MKMFYFLLFSFFISRNKKISFSFLTPFPKTLLSFEFVMTANCKLIILIFFQTLSPSYKPRRVDSPILLRDLKMNK